MADYLLVHGSWHGAWCWQHVVPLLEDAGHRAAAIDLPSHGEDRTPYWRATLAGYSRRIREAAAELQQPILVGHSMGGAAITRAAAEEPGAFAAMVYVCAYVPRAGESVLRLARSDRDSLLHQRSFSYRPTSVRFRRERAREVLYGLCEDDDVRAATRRLRPDPLRPLVDRMQLAHEFDGPRIYVECTQDRTVTISLQRAMARSSRFDEIVSLPSDHSPFLSMPCELAGHLDRAAGRLPR